MTGSQDDYSPMLDGWEPYDPGPTRGQTVVGLLLLIGGLVFTAITLWRIW